MLPSLFGKHYWFCLSRFVRLLGLVCHCKTQYSGHASFPLNTSPSEKQPGCDLVLQLPYMIVFSSGSNMFLPPPPPPPDTHTLHTAVLCCWPSVPLPVFYPLYDTSMHALCPTACVFYPLYDVCQPAVPRPYLLPSSLY